MSDKPDCYKCKWRQDLPGNAHSRCVNPKIPFLGAMGELAAMLGGGPTNAVRIAYDMDSWEPHRAWAGSHGR